jgi:hypothetical protein
MDKKLVFNITFHNQLEHLKFHLDVITKWNSSKNTEYVITSAHKENLDNIKEYCNLHFPMHKFDYLFIEEDHGYHMGTLINVNEGIKYINNNKQYDYLINIEGDNMFYDETKFLNLLLEMEIHDKHLLIVDWVTRGGYLYTNYPNLPKYHALTTLNIYSKYFIDNHYPLEYYDELTNFGWANNPGTPFEDYLGMAFNKKHSLDTEGKIKEYFNKWAYYLNYDMNWKLTPSHGFCYLEAYFNVEKQCYVCCGEDLPPYLYFRDALTPGRFVKYGMILSLKELEATKKFIEYYKPHLNTYAY